MTPLKIADEMESFARDGVRPDEWLLLEWAKHLRSSEAVQRDAARYRWLRSAGWFDDAIMEIERLNELFPETIDRAIDAAMKEATK